MRWSDLSLSAQTAYAELLDRTQAFELTNALGGLVGAFHKRMLKGHEYWYFAYRDIDQKLRMAYVGPDGERIRQLVERFETSRQYKPLAPPARMAIAAGCAPVAPKHFRIIKRLSEYGFFRAGGILIGTHAFLSLGNLLGVRWHDGAATLDVDFAHAGQKGIQDASRFPQQIARFCPAVDINGYREAGNWSHYMELSSASDVLALLPADLLVPV